MIVSLARGTGIGDFLSVAFANPAEDNLITLGFLRAGSRK
jgi:hypothetical protein